MKYIIKGWEAGSLEILRITAHQADPEPAFPGHPQLF